MDELIKRIMKEVGISEAQAKSAVGTVLSFVKERLPAPLAGQIEGLIGGDSNAAPGLDDLLGGILGGKK